MISVRRLTLADHDLAVRAVCLLKADEIASAQSEIADALTSFLSGSDNYFVVACDDETPVGFAFGYTLPRIDTPTPMLYLHEIFVAESYRRQGVGQELVGAFTAVVQAGHVRKLFMLTGAGNAPARGLFAAGGAVESDSCRLFEYRGFPTPD